MPEQKEIVGAIHRINKVQIDLGRDFKRFRMISFIGLVSMGVVIGVLLAILWATRPGSIQSAIKSNNETISEKTSLQIAASELTNQQPMIREYGWSQGQPAVKLLREDAGYCYLTHIQGGFMGGGEIVRIYREDGWWWLGGQSAQRGVAATAIAIVWDENGLPPTE